MRHVRPLTPALLATAALMGAGCRTESPLGDHWVRADLGPGDWAPLHGAGGPCSLHAGDGDYALELQRLAAHATGRVEVVSETLIAEAATAAGDAAYRGAVRDNGQAGSTARSICSVMSSLGALMGAR